MSSYHISLYFALFQQWNTERFGDWFIISRSEMMQLSRIGSANTYARCIKELSDWGYISYTSSSNIHLGSRVSCIRFDTATDTANNTGADTARNTGVENDTPGDTGTDIAKNTGTSSDLINDTATDIARNTSIKNDTTRDTGTDSASDTCISNDLKSDTGRNTSGDKIESTGIKNDTASDTATDTLFINSLNKKQTRRRVSQKKSKI